MEIFAPHLLQSIDAHPWWWLIVSVLVIIWPANMLIRVIIYYNMLRFVTFSSDGGWSGWLRGFFVLFRTAIERVALKRVNATRRIAEHDLFNSDPGYDLDEALRRVEVDYASVVRIGAWTGSVERLLLMLFAYFGQFTAMAFIMAAKALVLERMGKDSPSSAAVRKSTHGDITRNQEIRQILDEGGLKQETYLIGTFTSFSLALVAGLILASVSSAAPTRSEPMSEPSSTIASAMDAEPIVMDVDTGVDDALAIMLALHSKTLDLQGITTVSGNVDSARAALSTELLLAVFGRNGQIPVVQGADASLSGRAAEPVPDIHGGDGLGGVSDQYWRNRPAPRFPDDATAFLLSMAKRYGGELTIVGTGPLTNIAKAIQAEPQTMRQVKRLVLMAGALEIPGNITPYAEFNVHADPEAFEIVVDSGIPLVLYPLNVTEQVHLLARDLSAELVSVPRKLAFIREITGTYRQFHQRRYGFDGSFVHDALPIAGLLDPSLFGYRKGWLAVDVEDPERVGETTWAAPDAAGSRVSVATSVDERGVMQLFWDALRRPSPACAY